MKLFAEQPLICQTEILDESLNGKTNKDPEYYLEGVFMQANIENRNGRIYPLDIMQKEVARYDREYVQTGRAFGQLNHPTTDSASIDLEKVSHVITKIWQDGDYFKARAKILDTPCGRIVKAMIKEGCQLGVSSRALGSVTVRNGISYVNSDFHIITAGDIVFEPSAQAAFPLGIVNEDVEWELDPATGEYVQKQPEPPCKDCKDQPAPENNDIVAAKYQVLLGQYQQAQDMINYQKAEIAHLKDCLSSVKQLKEFDNLLKNIQ